MITEVYKNDVGPTQWGLIIKDLPAYVSRTLGPTPLQSTWGARYYGPEGKAGKATERTKGIKAIVLVSTGDTHPSSVFQAPLYGYPLEWDKRSTPGTGPYGSTRAMSKLSKCSTISSIELMGWYVLGRTLGFAYWSVILNNFGRLCARPKRLHLPWVLLKTYGCTS